MLDIISIRDEAFQHLHSLPHFSANVILLIEELEKTRDSLGTLQRQIDDDAMIIRGLADHYRAMEKVVITAKKYVDGEIPKRDFNIVWDNFTEVIKL